MGNQTAKQEFSFKMEYTLITKLKCTKPYVVYATRRFRQEMGAEVEERA